MNSIPPLPLARFITIILASCALACFAGDVPAARNYDLGSKKSFSYSTDPWKDPDLFIAVELLFHGTLRGEPGQIAAFCLLIQKITNDDMGVAGYAADLGVILKVRGDEEFAGELEGIALSKKEKQRIWDYLGQSVDKAKYPLTRKALLGK